MITVVVWLLIATSNDHKNYGTQTTLGMFPDKANCQFVVDQLPKRDTSHRCVMRRVVTGAKPL